MAQTDKSGARREPGNTKLIPGLITGSARKKTTQGTTMGFAEFFQRGARKGCLRLSRCDFVRKSLFRLRGGAVASGTRLPKNSTTWPHQVAIGRDCTLQQDIFFNFDHYWVSGPSIRIADQVFIGRGVEFNIRYGIQIESGCQIASGCKFIDHDHEMMLGGLRLGPGYVSGEIVVRQHAWLGANAIVLKSVVIGEGAVVAAGAVVTRSIPPGEIWGGVPAKLIRRRA